MLLFPVILLLPGLLLWRLAKSFCSQIPSYKGEGIFRFLNNAHEYAIRPIELVRKADAQCGRIFSIQVLTVYNVWLRGNELNKTYLETKEDVWSFGGGMVSLFKVSFVGKLW
jgi:sterol 14alpha-demethylase